VTAAAPRCAIPDTPLAQALPGIMTCVHCGFCLQACPTYLALGEENDSPRGRIVLMRSLVEGELSVGDADVHTHIDRCLGCRACETACPSGVPYGQLLEATRATLRESRPLSAVARLILWTFARPAFLSVAMAVARVARATGLAALLARHPGRLGFAAAMLASTRRAVRSRAYTRRGATPRERVAILDGCVMKGLLAETNRATERVLATNGYALAPAPGQRCCGALHAHAGDLDTARELARANIAAFERSGAEIVAVNAAGCGAIMKEYGHLLAHDPAWSERAARLSARVRDVSELLAAVGPTSGGALHLRATYDAPCHLLHAQRVARPPVTVLESIPELELVPLTDAEHCCGSAGIYNLLEPDLSQRVLAPKLAHIKATGASVVATGNPGCLMQIGAGLIRAGAAARVVHPVDLLDASYASGAP
jgi:glycolate oxidase iron-sulfur subunit